MADPFVLMTWQDAVVLLGMVTAWCVVTLYRDERDRRRKGE